MLSKPGNVRDAFFFIIAWSDYKTRKKNNTFLNNQIVSQSPIQRSPELVYADCPVVIKSVLVWMINHMVLCFRAIPSHDVINCL